MNVFPVSDEQVESVSKRQLPLPSNPYFCYKRTQHVVYPWWGLDAPPCVERLTIFRPPLLQLMIDFHSHILPALDDGAVTVDDSIAMAQELAAFGYRVVCCTPHCIRGYYDLNPKQVHEATLMLQADLDNANIRLDLWAGMEYMLDEFFSEYADNLLPLGETQTQLVLCEAPPKAHPAIVREGLELILSKGFIPLIAHPERTRFFYDQLCSPDSTGDTEGEVDFEDTRFEEPFSAAPGPMDFFKRFWPFASRRTRPAHTPISAVKGQLPEGCLFQANLGSFTGYYGETVQRRAYQLLKQGVYTALASDLHDFGGAAKVLMRDKVDTNPLLQKIAAFDGKVDNVPGIRSGSGEGQGELFS